MKLADWSAGAMLKGRGVVCVSITQRSPLCV